MDFKIGFLIKPFEILENNEITFISSSGVKPATYTESDCLAYGFIYNDSKCWSVQNSTSFLPPDNQNILQAGANNIIGVQSSDCSIIGINNELRFNDKNSLIVGDRNVINDDVNNTIVSGTKGDATATNSIVLGGNSNNDILGERQSIKLMYGGTTTNDSSTPIYLNTIVDKYLNIPINTAMSFNADILALRVGGTAAGDNGDFASWIERGVIINKNGVISVSTTNTPVVSSGTTTGWIPSSDIPTSSELVTNGDFATDTDWAKQAGWTISGGTANFLWDGSGNRNIYQSMLTVGTTYELKYDVLNFVAGSIRNVSTSSYVTRSANGSYTETFVATYSTLYLKCATSSNLSIDNVSVKEVIAPTGTEYNINVVGALNTTIEWASTINFTQIKTNITL